MDRKLVDRLPRRRCAFVHVLLVAVVAGTAFQHPLAAQTMLQPVADWKAGDDFEKTKEARTNLSGAACARTTPPLKSCLIVNDQKKYAQFFKIKQTTLEPKKVIRLVDEDADGDPDAEGAAYDQGYFYITGSHGRSRNHPEDKNESSYVVFRFAVDETSGKPDFKVSDDDVVGVDASSRLRDVIRTAGDIDKAGIPVSEHYDKPLGDGGVNIEGIAAKDDRLYFGLRGPSANEQAFVLSVDAAAFFTRRKALDARVAALKLGKDAGIRDLAAVQDGLLVLSGPVNEQDVTPAVFLWQEKTGALRKIGDLAIPEARKRDKAETLLVLSDVTGEPRRALIMFDGPANGGPTEYLLPR
jgi:hypothetical protein